MAIGKGKRRGKGGKRKVIDPFLKKEWYDIKAPNLFKKVECGKTVVSRTAGTRIASENLKDRVFEVSLSDLNSNEGYAWRKIKLKCEMVEGHECLTNFYGMDLTTDKLRSLVRKWQTLIEANAEVKTTDGYVLRLFCIGFTKRRAGQTKKTAYAKTSQIKQIRKKMVDVMTKEGTSCDLKGLVAKFIPGIIGTEIEKSCRGIFPLHDVYIRKVKMLKSPKFDENRILELHKQIEEPVEVEEAHVEVQEEEVAPVAPVVGEAPVDWEDTEVVKEWGAEDTGKSV